MKAFLLITALLPLGFSCAAKAAALDCRGALGLTKQFTLKAANGKIAESYAMMDQAQWTREGFEKAREKQFARLSGEETFYSFLSHDLQHETSCQKDKTGKVRVALGRVLVQGEGAKMKMLSIGMDLALIGGKWKVTRFASTAM